MSTSALTAFPLSWPTGKSRSARREVARFATPLWKARRNVREQLRKLEADGIVISCNVPENSRATWGEPDDPAVAVYFTRRGQPRCRTCDRWTTVADNLQAIAKSLEAARGISRWGTDDDIDLAVGNVPMLGAGVIAMDAAVRSQPWWVVLGVAPNADFADISTAYRQLVKVHHPDMPGGDREQFDAIQSAYDAAQRGAR